ncbi:methyltransferase domain-containing protein [Pseudoclavibacter chungangensis]|uniref:Methyltransferase domain-containing protein n=1 Tax=Pseudoclavibacter chungangensis TaxID=587635 RepID=A0A7J5BPM7_9MICO|nr:methyltransferase domain-containing protein [Pseudoclavibacter chungangensis]KAB1655120.1 methyltransferase domain-containing protein [Pseudoclavibacter chungangensis]NYJ66103.1 putative O-methyltransferase YrrM [Pseudoclavibacter chungangensis]
MSELDRNARFIEERIDESDIQRDARQHALELGLRPVSAATGAHLAFLAAASGARTIIEVGTGVGVTSLWLRRGAPTATLTAIDDEPEHLALAKRSLLSQGARPATLRMIPGRPADLLPRMTEAGYDLVVLGDDLAHVAAHLQHALRLVRPGGTIVVLNALNGGRVSDPARRDPITSGIRALLREFELQPDLALSVLPGDGGLLQITKRA